MSQLLKSITDSVLHTVSNITPFQQKASLGVLLGSAALYLGRQYFKGGYTPSKLLKESDLRGKVVLVTGASKGGIGYETVKSLYQLGATVVMAVRNVQRGQDEKKELEELCASSKNVGKLIVMKLDLEDLKSVREFCAQFLKDFTRLDILVNNAGLGQLKGLSKQNIEIHFAVNHLGHFLLVHFLKDLIQETSVKHSTQCKVINVSSLAHIQKVSKESELLLEPSQLINQQADQFPRLFCYGYSKMCNVLFAKSLARYFKKDPKANIGCYSLHPGVVSTNVFRNSTLIVQTILSVLSLYFLKTPESGAQTQIFLALEKNENLCNGGYYADCAQNKENPITLNETIQDKLWSLSEELCKDYSSSL